MAAKRKKQPEKKRKLTFTKMVVMWVLVLTTLTVIASYVLAAFDKQTVETLTGTIVASLATLLVTYCIKSLGEKASRNKYHLDENGNPIQNESGEP